MSVCTDPSFNKKHLFKLSHQCDILGNDNLDGGYVMKV